MIRRHFSRVLVLWEFQPFQHSYEMFLKVNWCVELFLGSRIIIGLQYFPVVQHNLFCYLLLSLQFFMDWVSQGFNVLLSTIFSKNPLRYQFHRDWKQNGNETCFHAKQENIVSASSVGGFSLLYCFWCAVMAITGHIRSGNWNGMERDICFTNNFQMRQIHTDSYFDGTQEHTESSARSATSPHASHILSDVFSVVPPEFKSHGGQRKRLAQGTYEERPTRERERERKEEGRAPKTTGKKHGPKEAWPLSFWLVEKHWECDFLNPSLSGRETGGRRTGKSRSSH